MKVMKKSLKSTLVFLLILSVSVRGISQTAHPEPKTLEIGARAPDFNLIGVDGKMYNLKNFNNSTVLVIIFSCNHCPTAQAYEDRLISLMNDYKSKGVSIVMISSSSVNALNYS